MTYRFASAGDLLADVREKSRKALAGRFIACAHQDVRAQLLPVLTQHVRGLNDQQIATWHLLLDHQEP